MFGWMSLVGVSIWWSVRVTLVGGLVVRKIGGFCSEGVWLSIEDDCSFFFNLVFSSSWIPLVSCFDSSLICWGFVELGASVCCGAAAWTISTDLIACFGVDA
ncbi:hypothetical protein Dimus_031172 [Dionaea muscipula]